MPEVLARIPRFAPFLARLSSGGDDVILIFGPPLHRLISVWRHESRRQRLHVRYV